MMKRIRAGRNKASIRKIKKVLQKYIFMKKKNRKMEKNVKN